MKKPIIETKPTLEKGRILRIKHGYNPNSSSMGSIIFSLPTSLLSISAGYGILTAILVPAVTKKMNTAYDKRNKKKRKQNAFNQSGKPS